MTSRADRLPRIGETRLGRSLAPGPGGKGSNQAVAAARPGAEAPLLTWIGRDIFGDTAMAVWAAAGLATAAVILTEAGTGSAFILVDDASGDDAIIVAPGDTDAQAALVGDGAVALVQPEPPKCASSRSPATAGRRRSSTPPPPPAMT